MFATDDIDSETTSRRGLSGGWTFRLYATAFIALVALLAGACLWAWAATGTAARASDKAADSLADQKRAESVTRDHKQRIESLEASLAASETSASAVADTAAELRSDNKRLGRQLEDAEKARDSYREERDRLKRAKTASSRGTAPRSVAERGPHGTLLGTFEATAYCEHGTTASGKAAGPGRIAVDPRVIPLGTKLHVEGYGECVACDTGGAVKGRVVDIWLPTRAECLSWGRRSVRVWRA